MRMVDHNGGNFERFQKIAFYPNRFFFAEVHWVIYIEAQEKIINFEVMVTLNVLLGMLPGRLTVKVKVQP